jgi:polyisoprenyl-phosphate glycosyltransferase
VSTRARDLISIVVPVFDEESNIVPFYDTLVAAAKRWDVDLEILFVDDGSQDGSFDRILELHRADPRVKALRFSRNFGSHPALTAGFRYATGAAAVLISVDLQDPPDLIGQFIEHWRSGHHVVWGVRQSRQDPWLKKTLANMFYAVIRRIALPTYPPQGMDFGLLDRRVLQAFNQMDEANRLVPALLVWAGFRQALIPYHRAARRSGVSKWPLAKRIKSAIDVAVSFSYAPIRLISYLGIAASLLGFGYGVFVIINRLILGRGGAGWPSVMVTVLFLGGLQLVMLGILGEYLWRTSEQVKRRPLYIVMDTIGLPDSADGSSS